jgi:hypothetical protein
MSSETYCSDLGSQDGAILELDQRVSPGSKAIKRVPISWDYRPLI